MVYLILGIIIWIVILGVIYDTNLKNGFLYNLIRNKVWVYPTFIKFKESDFLEDFESLRPVPRFIAQYGIGTMVYLFCMIVLFLSLIWLKPFIFKKRQE